MIYGDAPIPIDHCPIECPEYMHYMYLPVKMAGDWSVQLPPNLGWMTRLLDLVFLGELAHADRLDLGDRNTQRQLVLLKGNDEQFERKSCNFLLFDRSDESDAVRRIDDVLTRLESKPLHSLLGDH